MSTIVNMKREKYRLPKSGQNNTGVDNSQIEPHNVKHWVLAKLVKHEALHASFNTHPENDIQL